MQGWIDNEIATAQFCAPTAGEKAGKSRRPGNARLKKRFAMVLNSMSRKPSLKFTAACNGRAEVKAAYRFLDNEHVSFLSILGPHRHASIERIRQEALVLIPQDTTELDVTRPREIMVGAGPLNDSSRVGFHDHVSLALTPEHLPLGIVDAQVWARDPI